MDRRRFVIGTAATALAARPAFAQEAFPSHAITIVNGNTTFYLVRGDSAQIPPDLKARGFVPDATRWYIERYEDKTDTGGGQGNSSALRAPSGIVYATAERR